MWDNTTSIGIASVGGGLFRIRFFLAKGDGGGRKSCILQRLRDIKKYILSIVIYPHARIEHI